METEADELPDKQLLEKENPKVFDTEVKIKDGSVETDLEKVLLQLTSLSKTKLFHYFCKLGISRFLGKFPSQMVNNSIVFKI